MLLVGLYSGLREGPGIHKLTYTSPSVRALQALFTSMEHLVVTSRHTLTHRDLSRCLGVNFTKVSDAKVGWLRMWKQTQLGELSMPPQQKLPSIFSASLPRFNTMLSCATVSSFAAISTRDSECSEWNNCLDVNTLAVDMCHSGNLLCLVYLRLHTKNPIPEVIKILRKNFLTKTGKLYLVHMQHSSKRIT